MFFHQPDNSIGDDVYNAFVYDDIQWMPHLHKGFELAVVLEGRAQAENDGKQYVLRQGEAMLVLPYRLHSYTSPTHSKTLVIVFSGNYVSAFSRLVAESDAENCSVSFHKETFDYAMKIFLGRVLSRSDGGQNTWVKYEKPDTLRLKAALYAVCAEMYPALKLVKAKRNNSLLYEMITYIEGNYTADISLSSMADALGYDFRYLSRIFSRTFGVNFKTLVNQYRCDHAKTLILDSDATLSEIALTSGFQSIRSFNRVFREITGDYPSALRR